MARAATKLEETGEQALDAALLLTTVFEMLGFSARAAGVRLSVDMPPLEIADNGPGIPPDVEARIIMRSLVQEMGGTIHLGSAPRRGTLCRLSFPTAPDAPDQNRGGRRRDRYGT